MVCLDLEDLLTGQKGVISFVRFLGKFTISRYLHLSSITLTIFAKSLAILGSETTCKWILVSLLE